MKLRVTIDLDSDDMANGGDSETWEGITRTMQTLVRARVVYSLAVHDVNGNTIGTVKVTER